MVGIRNPRLATGKFNLIQQCYSEIAKQNRQNNYPAGLGKYQYAFTRSRSMYRPDAPRFIERLLPIFNVPGITLSSVQYRFKRPIK